MTRRAAAPLAPPALRVVSNPAVPWCLGLSAISWLALWALSLGGGTLMLCLTAPQVSLDGIRRALAATLFVASPAALALEWLLMVLAMMLPLALPHLGIFCARLYRDMRLAALGAALAGYLGIWMLVGLATVPLMLLLHALTATEGLSLVVPGLAWLMAIGWCYAPARRNALRRCHAVPVMYGRGADVYRGAFRYGIRLGGDCLVSCGFAMAAPMLAGQGIAAMALVTHVLLAERLRHRPTIAQVALPLTLIGLTALL
ncbi:DUF2182 domain-containing protein [Ferrimonas balearica]|nr:DUF2182 domain-containing protein [Ferrimonas balearica]